MDIPGELLEDLINSITEAFPSRKKFEEMLRFKLDFKLTIEADDLKDTVYILIEKQKFSIEKLIRGAQKKEPENKEIQNFIEKHIYFLLEYTDTSVEKIFAGKLVSILESIKDFDTIAIAFQESLGDRILASITKELEVIENIKISKLVKIYLILEILLKDFPYIELNTYKVLSILVFVELLLKKTNDRQIKQKLENWLDEARRQGYQLPIVGFDSGKGTCEDTCTWQPYLSIVIKKLSSPDPDRYSLSGYLLLESTDDSDKKIKLIPLQNYIVNDPKNQDNSEGVNYKTSKQFDFSFSQVKTEEGKKIIAKQLGLLIDESHEKMPEINSDKELIVEFFLPGEHFFESVDSWEIPYGVSGRCIKLSKKYNVIIRSYDRLTNPRFMKILEKSWLRINQIINGLQQDLTGDDLANYYQQNYARLTKMSVSSSTLAKILKEKIGLKLICKPPSSSQVCSNLIDEILEKGLPIIVWAKCQDSPENKLFSNFERFFAPNLMNNLNDLSTLVHQQRLEAFEAFEGQANKIDRDEINGETNQIVEQSDPNEHFYSYLTIYFEETNRLSKLHDHLKENIDNNKLRLGL